MPHFLTCRTEFSQRVSYIVRTDRYPGALADHVFVTDTGDLTPVVTSVLYDKRCSRCYLGHCHSEQEHARSIAEYERPTIIL